MNTRSIGRSILLSAALGLALMLGACGAPARTETPTPAPTATRTPTPTIEPSPTREPTAVALQPDATPGPTLTPLSPFALKPDDLPEGMERVNPADYGFKVEDLAFQEFHVDEAFAYVAPEAAQVVIGLRVELDAWAEQLAWQLVVANPEMLAEFFLPQASVRASPPEKLTGLEGIGEHAGGFETTVASGDTEAAAMVVVLDRSGQGAILISVQPEGAASLVSAQELARRWDARIRAAVGD